MSNPRNTVRLIGNLGMDPELREFNTGNKMAKFSLATSHTYSDSKGEKVTTTEWHNLIAWGKQAETAARFLRKGNQVAVEGRLTTRNYTDKDGNKRYLTEVIVHDFQIITPKTKAPIAA